MYWGQLKAKNDRDELAQYLKNNGIELQTFTSLCGNLNVT